MPHGLGIYEQVASLSMTPHAPKKVDLLKDWYLATLRKRAVETEANLTPAALINADRKQIEQLILSSTLPNLKGHELKPTSGAMATQACIGVSLVMSLVSATLSLVSSPYAICTIVIAAIFAAISLYIANVRLLGPLNSINRTLAKRGTPLIGSDSIPAVFERLLTERDELEGGKHLIVDSSSDALCCLDAELRIQALNKTMAKLFGYVAEEMIGSKFSTLILPDDMDNFLSAVARVKAGEAVNKLEVRARLRSHQAADLRLILDWSVSNSLFFVCLQDISDEKRLERARAEFVSTISHDIKIPLTSVFFSLEALTQQEVSAKDQHDTILRVESNVERLIGLIDELLEYERNSTSGKLPLRYSNVVAGELVDSAIEAVAPQAHLKQIIITADVSDITVQIDKSKIERTIINLLSNAVKFSPSGGEIAISGRRSGDMLEFKVVDNGPGIPDEYKHLIFERYERIPATEEVEGTGLGLSICKAIVESHRGLIGVKSPPSGGSEFWFNIPIKQQ